jgi:enamine deaminase RidA (YjgF/YER057c/UK114 family)
MGAEQTVINPWPWSVDIGYNQAVLVTGSTRTLFLAGQTAMDASGQPQHAGDMAGQLGLALDNVEAVLAAADMSLANVVRMNIYTTDIDAFFQSYGAVAGRLLAAGVQPPGTLLGVARLAFPELLVELEATAQD